MAPKRKAKGVTGPSPKKNEFAAKEKLISEGEVRNSSSILEGSNNKACGSIAEEIAEKERLKLQQCIFKLLELHYLHGSKTKKDNLISKIDIASHTVVSDVYPVEKSIYSNIALRVLQKIGMRTKNLGISVRYTSAASDWTTFTRTLFANTGLNLVDIFPKLESLYIHASLDDIKMSDKALADWITKNTGHKPNCFGRLTDADLWQLSCPQASLNLDALGEVPIGLRVTVEKVRILSRKGNIAIEFAEFGDEEALPLKTSQIRELGTDANHGFSVGNGFTNKLLKFMPHTLKTLNLRDSLQFEVPCQFPAGLEKLVLKHVNFLHPTMEGLPVGLQELIVDISRSGMKDHIDYNFSTLDITSLPPTITTLKIHGELDGWRYDADPKVTLIGVWPPAIKQVWLLNMTLSKGLTDSLPKSATITPFDYKEYAEHQKEWGERVGQWV